MVEEERNVLLKILTADLTPTEKLILIYVILCQKILCHECGTGENSRCI